MNLKYILLFAFVGLFFLISQGQVIGNYVTNGSFEDLKPGAVYPSSFSSPPPLVGWSSIDSNQCGTLVANAVFGNVPLKSPCDYQWPRTGKGFVMNSIFIQGYPNNRAYWRNRLRAQLTAGAGYCIKYYVNVRNCATYGIDTYGAFFGDNNLDTITQPYAAKIYLTSQINNPSGNFITDTLGWTALTGSFTATGNEKYLVIGDFKSDANTTYTPIVQPPQSFVWCDINIEDVSLIPVNLPAYAGPDKFIILGDSAFIGRLPDFALDPNCFWYKLPNTTIAIDTVAGLWVKPVSTSTYIVKQTLDCGSLQYDTVVVNVNPLGIKNLKWYSDNINLYPNPAIDDLSILFSNFSSNEILDIKIFNSLGQAIHAERNEIKSNLFSVKTSDLKEGIYQLHFSTKDGSITKQFIKN
jgi:hypothetical protein